MPGGRYVQLCVFLVVGDPWKGVVFVVGFLVVGVVLWVCCRLACQSAQQAEKLTILFEVDWENMPQDFRYRTVPHNRGFKKKYSIKY